MAVSGNDFIIAAEACKDLESEIGYRMCVGRSYYAMYHLVKDLLVCNVPPCKKGGMHEALVVYLQTPNAEPYCKKELRKLSYILTQGKTLRREADYYLDSDDINKQTAETQIQQAQKLVGICNNLVTVAA
jgi:uncharacterized protein (UPF0332 family)